MARLRHTVVLDPVPRAWFERAVGLGFDTVTDYFTRAGDPPGQDSRYELPDEVTTVHLESWQRDGVTSGRSYTMDGGMVSIWTVRLDSPATPATVAVSGDVRGVERGAGWLTALTGTATVDLPVWWAGTASTGAGPAITGRARHALFNAAATVTPAPAPGGRWQVTVRVTLRGAGVLRPLGSAAFLFLRRKAKQTMADTLDEFARRWNEELPALLARDHDDLRALITSELS
jgi:hypothetical protein